MVGATERPDTPFDPPPSAGDRLDAVRRILTWALLLALVVLVATGIWLFFWYRPTPAGAARLDTASDRIRWVHRWAAVVALATAAVALVLRLAPARRTQPRLLYALTAAFTLALLVVAEISGYRLPFNQLALFAVTAGAHLSGLVEVFRDHVQFVILGHRLEAPGTIRGWAITHLVVGAAAFLATAWLAIHHTADRLVKVQPRRRVPDASPLASIEPPTPGEGEAPSSSPAP